MADDAHVEKAREFKIEHPNAYWTLEIESAEKRVRKFNTVGDMVVQRFLDNRGDATGIGAGNATDRHRSSAAFRLNLFHTHVTTLMAMLYGRVPETDVSRRFADQNDDVSRIASELFQRLLDTSIEEPGGGFQNVLRACLQDRLLPGHGVARVRYEFDEGEDEDGNPTVDKEDAPIDYVHWRDFIWGYGRMWTDIPWIAFKLYMNREKVATRFGDELAEVLTYANRKPVHEDSEAPPSDQFNPEEEAEIFEIWDKHSEKVVFWSKDAPKLLETNDDPIGVEGFFPCPEPLIANPTTTMYMPTSDFRIVQDLYNEIDLLQTRISIITRAVKVVGVYDSGAEGVQRMLKEGMENDLIPVDSWAAFAEKGGLQGSVDWFPIADVVQALGTLEEVLDKTINLLYQVTGLSDILRGAAPAPRESAASATQRAKFASVRVQHLQDEFARFASDLMTLKAQVIGKHYEAETIFQRSNAQFLQEEQESIMQAIQLMKDPQNMWPWRIEIKPESIAMIDYAQLQMERTEFLTAMSTYLQSMSGLVQYAPQSAPMLLEMMKWGLAGFKGSKQIEGVVDKTIKFAIEELTKPKEQGEDPEMGKIQAKSQAKMMEQQQKHQMEMQKLQAQFKMTMQELQGETNAAVMREKMQAHFNILEKLVAESEARKTQKLKAVK